ncbi:MAG: HD domain-containing protein [candidate division NC10 bacterium]|jgi:HD superfamily phosphohydrolase|nr:HD domain-containing protein [candidate division NC10 bacterium]
MRSRSSDHATALPYEGVALLADPLYRYIQFTVPVGRGERGQTEKDLIDSPWMQRLRMIHQLQGAWWVYPAAEHSRFQHALGVMHLAGRFAEQLYPSLKTVCPRACPSREYVRELLRVTGLLHDIGHGPFGHFFDDNFLGKYDLDHERVGQAIIVKKLGKIIRGIRRSPVGSFEKGEKLDPHHVAFLIRKPDPREAARAPEWLTFLQPVFSGIYSADNMDYIQRDAYMTGFSLDMVDVDRLLFYTFFTEKGLTLHRSGSSTLVRFLNARVSMYSDVYYHRTNRAIDLHMKEIFPETMLLLYPSNPVQSLDRYLELTDWALLQEVMKWPRSRDAKKRTLGREWKKIVTRRVKWKMAYARVLSIEEYEQAVRFQSAEELERDIRKHLPEGLRHIPFRVDLAAQDTRPVNPLAEGSKRIHIFNPSTGEVSPSPLRALFKNIPPKVAHCRVFALNHTHDRQLSVATERALNVGGEDFVSTNI